MFYSVQVEVDAGNLPEPEENEVRDLQLPIDILRPETEEGEAELGDV